MQKYAKLKEALHKAISVNLRTNSKISCALLLAGVTPVKWHAAHRLQISLLLSNEKWGDKEISTFSDGNNQETAAHPDTLAYEYICEKICAVSSSVYLPFRGRFSNAQRPDGLEVTPASAGILCSLSFRSPGK